jgi:L-amino acid N-acyltransferase YncA
MEIREALAGDLAAIHAIYSHHVLHGTGNFELEPPAIDEVGRLRDEVMAARLPFLVAVAGDLLLGYAHGKTYRPRPGYRYTAEDSVYVAPTAQRRGVGLALLEEVLRRCEAAGIRQVVAVIGDSANLASIELHRRARFRDAGKFTAVGWKHGRWRDTVFMQRELGAGSREAPG